MIQIESSWLFNKARNFPGISNLLQPVKQYVNLILSPRKRAYFPQFYDILQSSFIGKEVKTKQKKLSPVLNQTDRRTICKIA